MEAITLSTDIQKILHQEAKLLAVQAYNQPLIDEEREFQRVQQELEKCNLINFMVLDKTKGIDLCKSKLSKTETIDLIASYSLKFPYDIFGLGEIPMEERALVHKWTGYQIPFHADYQDREEQYVYVTPNGTVYHLVKECTHLKLTIRETTIEQVKKERNTSGGKYKGCEKCYKKGTEKIYITTTGDRYHSSINCSGLKRTIQMISILKVGSRTPCSRCW